MTKPIDCKDCGACCMEQNLIPLAGVRLKQADELCGNQSFEPELPEEIVKSLQDVAKSCRAGKKGIPCIWFHRLTCMCICYNYRPLACRKLEVGGEMCLLFRERFGVG